MHTSHESGFFSVAVFQFRGLIIMKILIVCVFVLYFLHITEICLQEEGMRPRVVKRGLDDFESIEEGN